MNKQQARTIAKQEIAKITKEERQEYSDSIMKKVIEELSKSEEKDVFVFISNKQEPSTKKILYYLLENGYKVSVPMLQGEIMLNSRYKMDTPLVENQYGIKEPNEFVSANVPKIAIIPLVAYTDEMVRVGRGKGYYDRFLKIADMKKIGIAFSCQKVQGVEAESHDVALDMIITEKETLGE